VESAPTTSARRARSGRRSRGRASSGVVASYLHDLSDRHRRDRDSVAGAGHAQRAAGERPLWPILVLACMAQFMVILDVAVVNVALPSIHAGLGFSERGLQWVVNAYTLTFAGFLLLGGRASDLLGQRRVFVGGLVLFALASLIGGAAQGPGMLVGARAAQGIGAAVISPASLAILTTTFREGSARNRALGAWAAMGAAGGTAGVLLGGLLTDLLSWRWILFINVPIGIGVAALSLRFVAERRTLRTDRNFDLAGALTATLGLMAIVWAIVRTDVNGWGSAQTIGVLALGFALLGLFLAIEGRLASAPLLPLRIFSSRLLSAANGVIFLLGAAVFGMWFFASLYLQQVLGYSPLRAGLAFVPMTLTILVTSTWASRAVTRIGTRPLLVAGMLAQGAGLLLFSKVSANGSYLGDVLVPGELVTLGMGLAFVPATIAAVAGVAPSEAGIASGVVNTSRLLGGALGLAILATLATARTDGELPAGHAGAQVFRAALTDGFQLAFTVAAAFALAGALVAALLVRQRPRAELQAEVAAADIAA
jgi:EmrB/QacA subfamily drug resistance transporter